jgi:hypothetical protein
MKNLILRTVCVAAMAAFVYTAAQAQSKPGLWEITSSMKMNGASMPQIPPDQLAKLKAQGIKVPGMDGQQTRIKECVTQEIVDKYGGPAPHERPGCTLNNVQRTSGGMSAEMVCTGDTKGTATIKATHVDSTHSTMSMHFTGTNKQGRTMEFQMDSTSQMLSDSCGDVKPGQPVVE